MYSTYTIHKIPAKGCSLPPRYKVVVVLGLLQFEPYLSIRVYKARFTITTSTDGGLV
jgi:hypothetical protein